MLLLALGVLALRFVVLPQVARFPAEIAAFASERLGQPVSLGALEVDWVHGQPELRLREVAIGGADGLPALHLPQVSARLAWRSLLLGQPVFERLELVAPALQIERRTDGVLVVAGRALDTAGDGDGAALRWLAHQHELVLRDARITWLDHQRAAPPLELGGVDARALLGMEGLRIALRARPTPELAQQIDVRGEFGSLAAALAGTAPAEQAGRVYAELQAARPAALRPWLDLPWLHDGAGSLRLWLARADDGSLSGETRFALRDVRLEFGKLPPLEFAMAVGVVEVGRGAWGERLEARHVRVQPPGSAAQIGPFDVRWEELRDGDGVPRRNLALGGLDLDIVRRYAVAVPLPAELRARVAALAPQGFVEHLQLAWQGEGDSSADDRLALRVRDLSIAAVDEQPGVSGVSLELDGSARAGSFVLRGRQATLTLPGVFADPVLAFGELDSRGSWQVDGGDGARALTLTLADTKVANADLAGSAQGSVHLALDAGAPPARIDLKANLSRAEPTAVWRYLPLKVNVMARDWVQQSIGAGRVSGARLLLQGPLAEFPYPKGEGRFEVDVDIATLALRFSPKWPALEDVQGQLLIRGPQLKVEARSAQSYGTTLGPVTAVIPDLEADDPVLDVDGKVRGASADFFRYLADTPLRERLQGVLTELHPRGNGELALKLHVPLEKVVDTRVDGSYSFADHTVGVTDWLPPVQAASGTVHFTDEAVRLSDVRGEVLGRPLRLAGQSEKGGAVVLAIDGELALDRLRAWRELPGLDELEGRIDDLSASLRFDRQGMQLDVKSELRGLRSHWPAPFAKAADEAWPLSLEYRSRNDGVQTLNVRQGRRVQVDVEGRSGKEGWRLTRGGVGVFTPPVPVRNGLRLDLKLQTLDLDAWQPRLAALSSGEDGRPLLRTLNIQAAEVLGFGYALHDVNAQADAYDGGWLGRVDSREAQGGFDWLDRGAGRLEARLARLHLDSSAAQKDAAAAVADEPQRDEAPPRRLPALDIVAEQFALGARDFGRLTLRAQNDDGVWNLERLDLDNPDGSLHANGHWLPGGAMLTELAFTADVKRLGPFLARLGFGEVVHDGHATLRGDARWRGAPTRLDTPTLSGRFTLEAGEGRFAKLEPGVGRLLGVLSLQALPRRLKLDFSDVFSDGFVFERISGSIDMNQGVLSSHDLAIVGPAANIRLSGAADLVSESQDLVAAIQPTLTESVAIGAAVGLVNPAAGAAAYLAQKALSDPLERVFSFRYAIRGSWSAPRVNRVNDARDADAPSRGAEFPFPASNK